MRSTLFVKKILRFIKKVLRYCTSITRLPQVTLSHNPGETKTMEATTPELGPVRFWSPKSSSCSGSNSIVVEEAAKNLLSPQPSVNKSGAPNFFIQHDKVEDFKLRRYLETFGRALEQFLQRQMSSTTPLSSYSACHSTDW